MSEHNLKEIYDYANELLSKADPEQIDGAINWGDLSCTDVVMSLSVHGGSPWVRVDIEEADPRNDELKAFMYEKLKAKFPDTPFEINTEW